jgi:hypothetical protein
MRLTSVVVSQTCKPFLDVRHTGSDDGWMDHYIKVIAG